MPKSRIFPGIIRIWKEYSEALERKRKASQKAREQVIEKPSREKKPGLTYKEKQELEQLEKELESLENEKAEIEASFNDSTLSPEKLVKSSERLGRDH